MKKKIVRWLIKKVFQGEIVRAEIPTDITFVEYMPKDENWHHFAKTVEYWIKEGEVRGRIEDVYMDGGKIDEVRVWNDTRTDTEIHMNKDMEISGKSGSKKLIAYWRF